MEVWLAHRSLPTLALRLERECENALQIATFLANRPDVLACAIRAWPAILRTPSPSRQMHLYGPIVSFTLADRRRAELFLKSCCLVYEATSYGSVHTSAERRARWGGDAVPDGFIRLSAGIEDIGDLLEDLSQALDKAACSNWRVAKRNPCALHTVSFFRIFTIPFNRNFNKIAKS